MRSYLFTLAVLLTACATGPNAPPVPPSTPLPEAPSPAGQAETFAAEQDEGTVTAENWKSHPSIVAIRDLVGSVEKAKDFTQDEHRFAEPCETDQATSSTMVSDAKGRVRMLETDKGIDVNRTVTQFYDKDGRARFVMSTFSHASAESTYLSRRYLRPDGSTLFEPEAEQVSERGGPGDPRSMDDLMLKTAADASAEHQRLLGACGPQNCCCQYSDPAGAGLTRFSDEQGECSGGFHFAGCVDTGICDVATSPKGAHGKLTITLRSGTTVTVSGNPNHIYRYQAGDEAFVLFYAMPRSEVTALWTRELGAQGFLHADAGWETESHGVVEQFKNGEDLLFADFEEGCQDSSGTCVWTLLQTKVSGG